VSQEAVINSSQGTRSLELSAPVRSREELQQFTVTIRAEGLTASRGVYAFEGEESLLALFDEMVAEWRGWEGTKDWASLEGEVTLAATHNRVGTVTLRATLWHYEQLEWRAAIELTIDAGEQLTEAAAAIRRFVHAA
jgi:hypothetical protein